MGPRAARIPADRSLAPPCRHGRRRRLLASLLLGLSAWCAAALGLDRPPSGWRAFDDPAPIALDVDGDGRLDRVTPRLLTLRRAFIPGAAPFPGGDVERYIGLALETATGRNVGTLLQFRFGTENGGYQRYRLQPAGDLDGDRRGDLEFRVAGAPPPELIVLLDRGDRFESRSTGTLRCACAVDERLRIVAREVGEVRELARWDASRGRFAGDGVVWVIGGAATLREGVVEEARELATVPGGTALRRLPPSLVPGQSEGWIAVSLDGLDGWISARVVESHSPVAP